ncbi:hypothetical protein ES702_05267 [subsurface metagenome]
MPYIKKERYLGKSAEARKAQLSNLEKGRGKQPIKTKERGQPSKLDPFSPAYKNDTCKFLEDHFYIPETRSTVKIESWQRKEIFEPLFKIDPHTGLRQYSLALISTPKKNGKSTMAAMVALYFMFQDEPFGEIILTANSKDQSSWVVFDKLVKSLAMNPYTFKEVIIGDDQIKVKKTQTIVRIAAPNYKTIAGANPTLVCYDELWGYELDTARKFWDELTTVPTRKQPLSLVVSYAGHDEDSLLYELWEKGKSKNKPKNYFFYWIHENKASWITRDYLRKQRRRPGMRPNTFLRLHKNMWISYESSFIDINFYDSCTQKDHRPLLADRSKRLFIGIDIGLRKDTTGIVAVYRQEDRIYLAAHKCWRPTLKRPVKLGEVEAYISMLNTNFNIEQIRYDPSQFERSAEILRGQGIRLERFDQTPKRLTYMSQNLYSLLKDGNIVLYKDKQLRSHVEAATVKESEGGWRIVKKKSTSKIDLCIALSMACVGAIESPSYSGRPMRFIQGARRETGKGLFDYKSPVISGFDSPRDLLFGNKEDLVDGVYHRERTGKDRSAQGQAIPEE